MRLHRLIRRFGAPVRAGVKAVAPALAIGLASGMGPVDTAHAQGTAARAGAGASTTSAAATSTAATGWATTRTRAHTPAYATAVDDGELTDDTTIPIAVSLQVRDPAGLQALADRILAAGAAAPTFLTRQQFLDRHAPTAAQVDKVVSHLRASGFQDIVVADNRLLVTAAGTPSRVRSAFKATLHRFDVQGRRAYANATDAQVPAALADTVLAVVGLQTVHQLHTFARRAPQVQPAATAGITATTATDATGNGNGTMTATGAATDSAVTPAATTAAVAGINPTQFARIYGADGLPSAATATVGIITQGSMTQTVADLRTVAANAGYPAPAVRVVTVGTASTDTAGVDEWNLDTQTSLAAAGGTIAGMVLYTANTLNDRDITAAYNRAVSDNLAKVINVSLGECENSADSSGVRASNDQIFMSAIAQGQTFSVASGDSGAYGCGGSSKAQSYPATSPYVMAIGGTTLSTSGGAWAGETVWSCSSASNCSSSGGTGGGVSLTEPAPNWQTAAGVLTTPGRRGVPDIAFDGAPSSGAIILVNGKYYQIGGTSLSAPLFTGFYSRIQAAHGNSLGFPASTLYAGAASNPAWFHDITSGSNGGYAAGTGWDYVTGFGSLQVQNFSSSLVGGTGPSTTLTANFSCSPSGLTISCSDSSTDVGGTIAGQAWAFGDGGSGSGANPSHTYTAAGTYTVTETVTESGSGKTATKSASVTVTAPATAGWTTIATEWQNFTVSGTQTVRYGSGSSWITRSVTGSGACTNAFFGSDPSYGVVKQCQVSTAAAAPVSWTKIATENQTFTVSGTKTVRYGSGTAWVNATVTGSGTCSNGYFGRDPAYGVVKECDVGN